MLAISNTVTGLLVQRPLITGLTLGSSVPLTLAAWHVTSAWCCVPAGARHIFVIATYRRTSGSDLTASTTSAAPAAAMVIATTYPSVLIRLSCSAHLGGVVGRQAPWPPRSGAVTLR